MRAAVRERVILGLLAWARSVTDAPLQRSESAPVRAPPLRPVGRGAGQGAGGPTPPSVPGGLQRAYTAPPALSTRARVARGDAPPPGKGLGQQTGVASASTSTTGRCSPEGRFVYVPLREVGAPPASPTASATFSGGESGGAGGAWEAAPAPAATEPASSDGAEPVAVVEATADTEPDLESCGVCLGCSSGLGDGGCLDRQPPPKPLPKPAAFPAVQGSPVPPPPSPSSHCAHNLALVSENKFAL